MTRKFNLEGLRVLNTRPLPAGELLNQAILQANGLPIHCPALKITPSQSSWLSLLPSLEKADHAIFTSVNAVNFGIPLLYQKGLSWLPSINVIAIGSSTAASLEQKGISVHHLPRVPDSEHLLLLKPLCDIKNKTILLFKGKGGRPLLADTLKRRGCHLITLDVYQRELPSDDHDKFQRCWQERAVDIILFTSQEAMENCFLLFGPQAKAWILQTPCLVISQRLAEVAASLGIKTIILSPIDRVIETLEQFKKGIIHGQK